MASPAAAALTNIDAQSYANPQVLIMDFITTAIIGNAAYDLLKSGLTLSAEKLKQRLSRWIQEDVVAEAIAAELTKIGVNDEMSEMAITRRLDESPEIKRVVQEINANTSIVAPSSINTVTQSHNGSGDNVAGNKFVQ